MGRSSSVMLVFANATSDSGDDDGVSVHNEPDPARSSFDGAGSVSANSETESRVEFIKPFWKEFTGKYSKVSISS
jgi:hypothetical protein